MWAVFLYASIRDKIRCEQWQELIRRSRSLGDRWILGSDFNDIRDPDDKEWGGVRTSSCCREVNGFIHNMNMEEMSFQGRK